LRSFGKLAVLLGVASGIGIVGAVQAADAPPPAETTPETPPSAPPPSPAPAPARQVVLEIATADARDSEALAQVARELLGRLSVEVRAAQVSSLDLAAIAAPPRADGVGEPPLARVWIDWRTPGRATLYLLDAKRDRVLVRQVERPVGAEELAREELGHILETACEGLLAGGEVGVPRVGVVPLLMPPRPRAPEATVVEAPAAPAAGPARWQLAVLYEAALLAPEAPLTHGPEASVFLGTRALPWRWGAWATAQLRLPVHAAEQDVGVELETGALRALLALERPLSPRVTARAGVGGGVDLVHARPEASSADLAVLDAPYTRAFAVGRAAVAFELRLASRLSLVGTLAADVDVTGQKYAFSRGDAQDVVLRPWIVRPAAALGLAFP
jgi:hypothetical protein